MLGMKLTRYFMMFGKVFQIPFILHYPAEVACQDLERKDINWKVKNDHVEQVLRGPMVLQM